LADFVLKLYRRFPPAAASKVIRHIDVQAPDRQHAVEEARKLYADASPEAEFAMLFVKEGDVVWVSD
jgi:hypothetical protein